MGSFEDLRISNAGEVGGIRLVGDGIRGKRFIGTDYRQGLVVEPKCYGWAGNPFFGIDPPMTEANVARLIHPPPVLERIKHVPQIGLTEHATVAPGQHLKGTRSAVGAVAVRPMILEVVVGDPLGMRIE
jgi:hypothetical protein